MVTALRVDCLLFDVVALHKQLTEPKSDSVHCDALGVAPQQVHGTGYRLLQFRYFCGRFKNYEAAPSDGDWRCARLEGREPGKPYGSRCPGKPIKVVLLMSMLTGEWEP